MKSKLLFLALIAISSISAFSQEEITDRRAPGCREWSLSIGSWTILTHHNSACGNTDGNWDWGGNGTNTTNIP